MEENNKKAEKSAKKQSIEKPTYEQLNEYCNQLMMQNRELGRRLQEINGVLTRLPLLFQMLEKANFFSDYIIDKCVTEICDIMFPEEETDETEDQNQEEDN